MECIVVIDIFEDSLYFCSCIRLKENGSSSLKDPIDRDEGLLCTFIYVSEVAMPIGSDPDMQLANMTLPLFESCYSTLAARRHRSNLRRIELHAFDIWRRHTSGRGRVPRALGVPGGALQLGRR